VDNDGWRRRATAAVWTECSDRLAESTSRRKGHGNEHAGQGTHFGTGGGDRRGVLEVARHGAPASQANKECLAAKHGRRTSCRRKSPHGGAAARARRHDPRGSGNRHGAGPRDPTREFERNDFTGWRSLRAFIAVTIRWRCWKERREKRPRFLEESTSEPHGRNGAVPAQGDEDERYAHCKEAGAFSGDENQNLWPLTVIRPQVGASYD
jgi:hypothetical protein